jgi:hypothetical protein
MAKPIGFPAQVLSRIEPAEEESGLFSIKSVLKLQKLIFSGSPLPGFSPRKAATVLYNVGGFSGSEALRAKLGKHSTGKGCLYIKKLAEVDQQVLETLVLKSVGAMRVRYPS